MKDILVCEYMKTVWLRNEPRFVLGYAIKYNMMSELYPNLLNSECFKYAKYIFANAKELRDQHQDFALKAVRRALPLLQDARFTAIVETVEKHRQGLIPESAYFKAWANILLICNELKKCFGTMTLESAVMFATAPVESHIGTPCWAKAIEIIDLYIAGDEKAQLEDLISYGNIFGGDV